MTRPTKGLRGVRLTKSGTFEAWIGGQNGRSFLGTFKTAEEAGAAYDRAAADRFGSFARLNFPDQHRVAPAMERQKAPPKSVRDWLDWVASLPAVSPGVRVVPLSGGKFSSLVSESDFALVNQWKWQPLIVGGVCRYAYRSLDFFAEYMHRLILNAPADKQVDHIDRNGLNNVRGNLRIAEPWQNAGNRVAPTGRPALSVSAKGTGVSRRPSLLQAKQSISAGTRPRRPPLARTAMPPFDSAVNSRRPTSERAGRHDARPASGVRTRPRSRRRLRPSRTRRAADPGRRDLRRRAAGRAGVGVSAGPR